MAPALRMTHANKESKKFFCTLSFLFLFSLYGRVRKEDGSQFDSVGVHQFCGIADRLHHPVSSQLEITRRATRACDYP